MDTATDAALREIRANLRHLLSATYDAVGNAERNGRTMRAAGDSDAAFQEGRAAGMLFVTAQLARVIDNIPVD